MPGELLAAVIHLAPDPPLPVWSGRAGQSWLLNAVRRLDPALADWLHAGQNRRPYTISVPRGGADARWMRITSLSADLSTLLRDRLLPELQSVALVNNVFPVTTIQIADHPWAGSSDFETLARSAFAGAPDRFGFEFATPTAFHHEGLSVPLPVPTLLYGSLIQAWNSYSPVPLPLEMGGFVTRHVGIARHRMVTHMVQFGSSERHVGFTGSVTLMLTPQEKTSLSPDSYRQHLQVLHLLTLFAFYAGVGIRTTVGMGQVHQV